MIVNEIDIHKTQDPFEKSLNIIADPNVVFTEIQKRFPIFVVMRLKAYVIENNICYTKLQKIDFENLDLNESQKTELMIFCRDELYFSIE